jgi:hypothetical protein
MARVSRGVGNKEGDGKEKGKGSKGNGDGNKGGGQAYVLEVVKVGIGLSAV